jgi:hypothetical protein
MSSSEENHPDADRSEEYDLYVKNHPDFNEESFTKKDLEKIAYEFISYKTNTPNKKKINNIGWCFIKIWETANFKQITFV